MNAPILLSVGVASVLAIMAARAAAAEEAGLKSLTDKTLVAWAAPANLTQRGGSALTIATFLDGHLTKP